MNLEEATAVELIERLHQLMCEPVGPTAEQIAAELERELHEGEWFTVCGSWLPNSERYAAYYQAPSWQAAENLAMMDVTASWLAAGQHGEPQFLISATFPGKLPIADWGATFSDHDEPL